MIFVTKFDGRKEPFYKSKVVRTCMRMHATPSQAKAVADKVEREAYDGIPTKEILRMIFTYMKEFKPEIKHQIDLREAISLLRPKPDFEKFIALLLRSEGYEAEHNKILSGGCIEHELDAIAKKNGELVYVEVKHHFNHHAYTGLDVVLEVNSTFEDLKEGYKLGKHSINFTRALVVCNTKISEHAKRYAACKGIGCLGWRYPEERGLEQIIEEKKLYPITFLKGLDKETLTRLGDAGIVLLKQLLECSLEDLRKKTRIPINKLKDLVKNAKEIIQS
jgi:hypothetical protein